MNRSKSARITSASGKGRIEPFLLLLVSCLLVLGGASASFSQTKGFSTFGTKLDLTTNLLKNPVENVSSDQVVAKRKSPSLAAFASLAVPGLGELYAGRYDAGKFSTIAEVSLWVLYTVMEVHSDQVRSDAINYARINAGAQVAGKPDVFFVNIGNYLNSRDYNEQQVQNGNYPSVYNPSTMPSYQWQWQSDADRAKFKEMRIEADQFLNYGRYTAAVVPRGGTRHVLRRTPCLQPPPGRIGSPRWAGRP